MRWIDRFALAVVLLATSPVLAADLAVSLKTLQAVGPQGAGHAAAAEAWQAVAAAPPEKLPEIIAALDAAQPLAANWIRAAIDTIAERQLRSKSKPPIKELEALVLDTSHTPKARRLAFEWLTRFDSEARERLVPQFLDDPSVELRRDAVARLMKQAETVPEADKPALVKVLRQAFTAARDQDQVDALAKQLEKLGEKVDLSTHYGFITTWKLIGPFDNTGESAFEVAYPPEKEINLAATYPGKKDAPLKWIDHTTSDPYGKVDLNKALGKAMGVVGYATAEFHSDVARDVDLRMDCICAAKVWLNGEQLGAYNVYHSGSKFDQYVARGKLKAGKNVILVKVLQNEQTQSWAQDWEFSLRVCDSVGTPVRSNQ